METPRLEATANSGMGSIESDVRSLLSSARSCAASWMKDYVLALARSEPIIRNGNGIAKKLMYIFEREHVMSDTDFNPDTDPSKRYIDFSILADCTLDAQVAILRKVCEADRYGHASAEARRYAQENRISFAA